ncbi:hypothetical protein B5E77_00265 [Lachnoclostridium sp. An131]|uniref:hypothetical protein n=1 Tax=Lachnoclostridium sp. An131 TaxID=1965555 RepID=UPI000B3698BF|nr:hypothetical protein [Lachnoclostridium sp. An131]OUQ28839.1 hypothetical protein B5E77_00265 [Lachnoclostridium sp. An131]
MNKRINISKKGAKPNIAKALSCLMALLLLLSLYGCSKQETGSAVTSSNVIAEVEIPEPDESLSSGDSENIGESGTVNLPSGMEDIESGSDVEVDGETVGETALTQEEIDALRASTSDDIFLRNLERYEEIMENGSCDNGQGGTLTNVVGTPGDESWRNMTKAEAEAILAERPYDIVALAEASDEPFARVGGDTIYFDPYAYNDYMEESAAEISVNGGDNPADPELVKRLEEASGIHDGRYSGIPD